MASSGTDSRTEEIFKPIEPQSADDTTESHGRREDLTADMDVKAPGIMQRMAEEVQAIAVELWPDFLSTKK
ncbi:uncharacterized protein [Physcomitrium patens]|uniref:Uncharacterized protein n=1 Tax=Physcomitrium patens TaxID=3218 RepID=A0A2K1IN15_PHYPA|nr:hypothetical protein PHYPA_026985 [Physcomitrium patens]